MKVKELMRTDVVTLDPAEKLDIADDIMRLGRIRHLPVVDRDRRVLGMVTQQDLLEAAVSSVLGFTEPERHRWLGTVLVAQVMKTPVATVSPDQDLADAVETMLERKIGAVPVVTRDGVLAGLLTESDCLRHLRDLLA